MVPRFVCGKEVDEKNWIANGSDKLILDEKTYWFCGLVCKQKVVNSPDEYLGETS